MRLHRILPCVEPAVILMPATCPYEGCDGIHFCHHQEVAKALRDTVYPEVTVHRHQCLGCKRTFRV